MLVSPTCKACNSPNRGEIERRLLEGESPRAVSAWLEKTYQEKASHVALRGHRNNHMAVLAKAKEVLAQANRVDAQAQAAVDKVVATIETLDEIVGMCMAIARPLHLRCAQAVDPATPRPFKEGDEDGPAEPDSLVDMPSVVLLNGVLKEARECIRVKYELIHGKKVDVDVNGLNEFLGLAFPDPSDDPDAELDEAAPEPNSGDTSDPADGAPETQPEAPPQA